ncbi:MAG: hypothetical protein BMS9Abin02_1439 [Anaerolineae bacterium]|nr:MAG: hypothetical protein BMS9Abin02_1439 [Anaerolineae bacterium]
MASKRIETGHGPELIVKCRGDLKVRGWAEPAVRVKGDSLLKNSVAEKVHHIESDGDLQLMVPSASVLSIAESAGDLTVKYVVGDIHISETKGDAYLHSLGKVEVNDVQGDLSVRNLSGQFRANEVMGDVSFRNVLGVSLAKISGDCSIRNVNGDVQIKAVMGDLSLRTVSGNVTVNEVYRDAILRNLGGQTQIGQVYGDVRLRGGLAAGKHNFKANGDIVIRWPAGAPVDIQATAPKISCKLNLEDLVEEPNFLSGHIGQGSTFLILEAKGRIIVKGLQKDAVSWDDYSDNDYDIEAELAGLGMHISGEINSRMNELSQHLERKFGPEFTAKMELQAQKAALKAERAAEKAMRKAEKAARKVQWQMARTPPRPPKTRAKGGRSQVSEEEQLKILKMVEKGIISPTEANELLAALDGS